MQIAVAGSSGFIGGELLPRLQSAGHDVLRLVRRPAARADEVSWNPGAGTIDLERLGSVEAIVNLAGAGVGDRRRTEAYKKVLYDSHVGSAQVLARAAAELAPTLRTLVSAGSMGYYGNDTHGRRLVEDSAVGSDFLARVIADKEQATTVAAEAGVRVVLPRLTLVMGSAGSTMGRRLLPLAKVGLLGPLAGGRSIWPVVSVQDTARAIEHMLTNDEMSGPYNVSAPEMTTNGEFTRLIGEAVHRPTVIPVPKFALTIVLGEFADDVLADFNVDPQRLIDTGFTFEHRDAEAVVAASML
ncbi:MAG: TIGR01777 family oxidoreductase [Jiangellales bacterium]